MSLLRLAVFAALFVPARAPAVDASQAAQGVVAGTNAFRESQGLQGVEVNRALDAAAQRFARYMAKSGKYGHEADGRRPPERAQAAGYDYCIVSENLAWLYRSRGYASPAALAGELVEGWKRSPEHRKNMVEPAVTETGVGIARAKSGRYFAVQLFGRPKRAALSFSLANRSADRVEYRLGGEGYSLAPRTTRTHTICRPAELQIGGYRVQAASDARYVVSEDGRVRPPPEAK